MIDMGAVESFQNKLGLNDAQFSHYIGVSPSLISRIKKGERKPANAFINGLINAGMKPEVLYSTKKE